MRSKKEMIIFFVFTFVIALLFVTTGSAHAAPIDNFPVSVTQPDGTVLHLFASGDEYYNWLQDAQGYTVMRDPLNGYYVYANLVNGQLQPTKYTAGSVNPSAVGLQPYLNISPEQKSEIRQAFFGQTKQIAGDVSNAPTAGTINNLVVFIRFSDEPEFTTATSMYTDMFNNPTPGANSLRNYYQEASYGALTIDSTFYPTPLGTTVVSYQDSHARAYYQPYDATTNPDGYPGGNNGTERTLREETLLRDAINSISSLVSGGLTIDADNDDEVDSLTFIVSGWPTGWSSLLWPHQGNLSTYTVTINGKTVAKYSFHLNSMLYTGVLAHEMFHVLGAPDLYHYIASGIPVGPWDLMEQDGSIPQHMGCYMKFKYGKWISSIPELSAPGTYTLKPLTLPTDNCYKIASPNSTTEFFVLEYRNKTMSAFESSLPGSGLLVYRINTSATGNAFGPPDEVYVYRPGGTNSETGNSYNANFSSNVGRTAINDATDPSSFLSDGSAGGLDICHVGASNATISFDICAGSVVSIRGNAGVRGATLSYLDGTPQTVTSDSNGLYSIALLTGWSGSVIVSKPGYIFSPASRSYTNVLANQTAQDYTAVGPVNLLRDPSFELYTPNPYWTENSTNFGTPLCSFVDSCRGRINGGPQAANSTPILGPQTGSVWGWFGGTALDEAASLSQAVIIPKGTAHLEFYFQIGYVGAGSDAADVFIAKIDGVPVFSANANEKNIYQTYTLVNVDVSAYADGAAHTIMFSSVTSGQVVYFSLDDVALLSKTSVPIVVLLPPVVTASDGTDTYRVNVSWTASSGATYYLAYRSDSLTGSMVPASGIVTNSLNGVDTWAAPGVTYYYWVRACNASGCSSFSAPDTGWQGLPAPVITASDGVFPDKVQVTFPAVSWATSYIAYRSLSQEGVKIPTDGYFTIVPGGDDLWAAPGVTYYYWVKACYGLNCSALSAYDTGWR